MGSVNREQLEVVALKQLRRGAGKRSIDHPNFDQVYVAPWLEDFSRVNVYFFKNSKLEEMFQFEIKEVPEERQEKFDEPRMAENGEPIAQVDDSDPWEVEE